MKTTQLERQAPIPCCGHRRGLISAIRLATLCLAAGWMSFLMPARAASLEEALDTTNLVWTTGGDVSWTAQTEVTHDGMDAAQSGSVVDYQESWLQTTVTGMGTLTFSWKVSSEMGADFLEFYIDDALQLWITGEEDWSQQSFDIADGAHTVRWRYVKYTPESAGLDHGWLDQVAVTVPSNAVDKVLLLADSDTAFRQVPVLSPYQAALKAMGMTYQFFSNDIAFAQAVSSADPSNTVLIVDAIDYEHDFSSVANFVNAGGRAILQYWNLGADAGLAVAFDVSVGENILFPLAVYEWGDTPLFDAISSPVDSINLFNLDGQKLEPTGGGQAVAGFVSFPTANQAALVIGNENRTIVNGFALEEVTCGTEAIRLAQNEILSLTTPASATAPAIAVQPVSQTVAHGATVSFRVVAWGEPPLSYRWHKDGAEIEGATDDTYSIDAVRSSDEGAYSVVVSNAYNSVVSDVAALTLTNLKPVQSVLLLLDIEGIGIPSRFETALTDVGIAYQEFTDANAFAQAVEDADPFSTLLILDIVNWSHNLTSTANFVNAGGRAILQYWDLIEDPCLAAAFDASVVQTVLSPPPVYDWSGSTFFVGMTSPILFADLFNVDGQRFEPTIEGQALAGFVSSPTSNQASLLLGNEGRTIVNGFALEEITSAAQGVQLAENEILYFFPPTIESISLADTRVTLTWTAIPFKDYQVQSKDSPTDLGWTDLGFPISAFDTTASTTDTMTNANQRFYRVQLLP